MADQCLKPQGCLNVVADQCLKANPGWYVKPLRGKPQARRRLFSGPDKFEYHYSGFPANSGKKILKTETNNYIMFSGSGRFLIITDSGEGTFNFLLSETGEYHG